MGGSQPPCESQIDSHELSVVLKERIVAVLMAADPGDLLSGGCIVRGRERGCGFRARGAQKVNHKAVALSQC